VEIEDREIEYSPLSGRLTHDGVTVDVKIYRFAGTDDLWQLEVVDHNNWSVEEDGMASFIGDWGQTVH
jgi:hypothetical protein